MVFNKIFKLQFFLLILALLSFTYSHAEFRRVFNTASGTAAGTLGGEIQTASSGDTIVIDVEGVLNLTSSINVNADIVIIGPSAKHFSINGSGLGSGQVFQTSANKFTLIGIKIENFSVPVFQPSGGGIVEVYDCSFKNNSGYIFKALGSYIGTSKFVNCSYNGNTNFGGGSAYYLEGGTLEDFNCTYFNGNSSNNGGVSFVGPGATLRSTNCTFNENNASVAGGAIYNEGTVFLRNNIFKDNTSGGPPQDKNISGNGTWITDGGNVINNSFAQINNYFSPIGNDVINTNPDYGLSTVALEDGYGLEHFPIQSPGSECLDLDSDASSNLPEYDARKIWRKINNMVDAGACEYTPFRVVNTASSGAGSLNDAIQAVSGSADFHNAIVFEIAPYGTTSQLTISPDNSFAIDKNYTIINGFSQPMSAVPGPGATVSHGTSANLRIVLDGGPSAVATAFDFMGTGMAYGSSLAGVAMLNYNTATVGIYDDDITILGCHIGLDNEGYNAGVGNAGKGIEIDNFASNAKIGKHYKHNVHRLNSRNVIAGFSTNIAINGGGYCEIVNNFIGIQSDGTDLPSNVTAQSGKGIEIVGGDYNRIGGDGFFPSNVIAGCSDGMLIITSNNDVINNAIGTSYHGNSSNVNLKNVTGINLNGGSGNYIGLEKLGNVIVNNSADGIIINGSNYNLVAGNRIGLGEDGTSNLGNGQHGISLINSLGNTIGLAVPDGGNYICNNVNDGIHIQSSGAVQDTVYNNHIGVNEAGNAAGNDESGISIAGGANDITIGGIHLNQANVIANNAGTGINADNAVGSLYISGNSMEVNAGLGIDLDGDGSQNLNVGTAPIGNNGQIPPTITSAFTCGGGAGPTTIGFTCDFTGNYLIEFFNSDAGNEEGKVFLDQATIFVSTAGDEHFHVLPSNLSIGWGVVAVATSMDSRTSSEFSAPFNVTAPPSAPTITPTSHDVCDGSLPGDFTSDAGNSLWFSDAGLTTKVSVAALYNPGAQLAGTYSYYAVDSIAGCFSTASVATLNVNANPMPSVTGNLSPCEGSSEPYTVSGGAGSTYVWSTSGGTLDGTGFTENESITWDPPTTADINVTETDINGCNGNAYETVTISSLPVITIPSFMDVGCFGAGSGSAVSSVSGGTSPFTYLWSNGATTQNISFVTSGSYTVTVTDANNCSDDEMIAITEPSQIVVPAPTWVDPLCSGGADGSLSITTPSGDNPPFNFQWYEGFTQIVGETAQTISGVGIGTYHCTVSDANGCVEDSPDQVLTEPSAVSETHSTIDASCFGVSDGQINMTATGGTSPYQYSIDGGGSFQGTGLFIGLSAGTYNIEIQDANACNYTTTIDVVEPVTITYSNTTITDVACFGQNAGDLTINGATGGAGGFTYSIDGGSTFQASNLFSSLFAGTYSFIVEDATGCQISDGGIVINEPGSALSIGIASGTDPLCAGAATGNLIIGAATGGAPAYTYDWYDVSGPTFIGNGQSISSAAGDFYCEVTDANGCLETSSTVTLSDPFPISATFSKNDVLCFGDPSGDATANPSGGVAPYSYQWDAAAANQNTQTAINLAAGTYIVTVSDINSCTVNESVTITEPATAISMTKTFTNISCNGANDGSIDVTPSGGTPPYSFDWDNDGTGDYDDTEDLAGLSPGTYSISIMDANGCTIGGADVIIEPAIEDASFTLSDTDGIICKSDGNITATITGTSGGGFSSSPVGLNLNGTTGLITPSSSTAGVYTVTYTTPCGIFSDLSVTIEAEPTVNVGANIVECEGNAVSLSATGTAPGFTWSTNGDGIFGNGFALTDTYMPGSSDDVGGTVTLTLMAGGATACPDASSNLTLTITPAPVANAGNIPTVCANNAVVILAGSVANAGGGSWSTAPGTSGSFSNVNDLFATYTPSPADTTNGSATIILETTLNGSCLLNKDTTTISILSGLYVGATVENDTCANGIGKVNLSAIGGNATYNYSFDGGTFSPGVFYSGLVAGTYTIQAQDGNGCMSSIENAIINDHVPTITFTTPLNEDTCSSSVGGIQIAGVTGGTAPYQYSIDGATYVGSNIFSGLSAGPYSLYVKDVHGCTGSVFMTLNNYVPTITFSSNLADDTCFNGLGEIEITGETGGSGPYTYSFDNGTTFGASNLFGGLTSSSRDIQVKDVNGCTSAISNVSVGDYFPTITFSSNLAPDTCSSGLGEIEIIGETGGLVPYTYSFDNGNTFGASNLLGGMSANTYPVQIKDINGCTSSIDNLVITNYTPTFSLSVTTVDDTCGIGVGEIQIAVTGGTGPYQYSIDNGSSYNALASQTGVVAGAYNVMIMDVNGCVSTAESHTVNNYGGPVISIDVLTNVTCFGGSDGEIQISVTGGNAPYNYTWNGSNAFTSTNSNISGLSAATYDLDIVDASGCAANAYGNIVNEPSAGVSFTYSAVDISCNGAGDGTFTLTGAGGNGSYTYSNDNGSSYQTGASFTTLNAGSYDLMVMDDLGCTSIAQTATITDPVLLAVTINSTNDVNCFGDADGSMVADPATGGTGAYYYQWYDNNGGSAVVGETNLTTANVLAAGVYYIEVTDDMGCTATSPNESIIEPAEIVFNVTTTQPLCSGNNGEIVVDVISGGTSPFNFTLDNGAVWNTGTSPMNYSNLPVGNYDLNVRDANMCLGTAQNAELIDPIAMTLNFVAIDENCFGDGDGSIDLTVSGGTAPYQFDWDNDGTGDMDDTEDLVGLAPSLYSVSVVDANGCNSNSGVTISGPSIISFTATSAMDTCSLGIGEVYFSNVTGGSGTYGYSIDNGNTFTLQPIISGVSGGSYIAAVGDNNGCGQGQAIVVGDTIGAIPNDLAGVNDEYFSCPGIETEIEAFGGDVYGWYNTENDDTTTAIQLVSPLQEVTYYVLITAGSCSKTDSTIVRMDSLGCDDVNIVTNNVFSPDGDNINDVFVIGIDHLLDGNENTVTIYNRWGDVINSYGNYNNIDIAWDGTNHSGTTVSPGTYFYTVEIPSLSYTASGWVEVVR